MYTRQNNKNIKKNLLIYQNWTMNIFISFNVFYLTVYCLNRTINIFTKYNPSTISYTKKNQQKNYIFLMFHNSSRKLVSPSLFKTTSFSTPTHFTYLSYSNQSIFIFSNKNILQHKRTTTTTSQR